MKQKKSQSHVEIILSFTLFLSTVLIIFLFLNPLAKSKIPESDINKIQQNILKNTQETVGSLSIITTQPDSCYNFPQEYQTEYTNDFIEKKENPRKYILYFSENLFPYNPSNQLNNNPLCQLNTYSFGIYTKENITTYNKLLILINNYDTDYNNLKKALQTKNDLKLTFKNIQDKTEISELTTLNPRKIPQETNVQAKEFPIRVITDSGEIKEIMLNIQVW